MFAASSFATPPATASAASPAAASTAAPPAAPAASPAASSPQEPPAASPSSARGYVTPGPAKQLSAKEHKKTSSWGSKATANKDRVVQPRVHERSTPGIPRQVNNMSTCLVPCVINSVYRLLTACCSLHLHLSICVVVVTVHSLVLLWLALELHTPLLLCKRGVLSAEEWTVSRRCYLTRHFWGHHCHPSEEVCKLLWASCHQGQATSSFLTSLLPFSETAAYVCTAAAAQAL